MSGSARTAAIADCSDDGRDVPCHVSLRAWARQAAGDAWRRMGRSAAARAATAAQPELLVVGKESVGKSQLIASLSGVSAGESNYRGSTVTVQRYRGPCWTFVDTPGILRHSDTETTRTALGELDRRDAVMLVCQATQLDDDLADMLPLVRGKRGLVVVTYWDKVADDARARRAIASLSRESGVDFVALDARRLSGEDRHTLQGAIQRLWDEPASPERASPERAAGSAPRFSQAPLVGRASMRIQPAAGPLDHWLLGPMLAIFLLLLPAVATILGANRVAALLDSPVEALFEPLIRVVDTTFPGWMRVVLTAESDRFGYGLLNMGPFLLLWALPTVLLFALIIGLYKTTGLAERINTALHPWLRPLGLSGRDALRVMMGFGCNVPAVISTRACSGCSRGTAVAAIAFGAACSYQLPASLAVLAVAGAAGGPGPTALAVIFLAYLLVTTLLYLRLTSPATARDPMNQLVIPRRSFLQRPTLAGVWREARGVVQQFLVQALPVFALICVLAALAAHGGLLDGAATVLGPVMRLLDLPAEAALAVVMASIRKDGIFLLAGQPVGGGLTAAQSLTAVYLAGVLLPCLVTALAIARETGWAKTLKLLARQFSFAIVCSLVLAWGGRWLL